MARKKRFDDLMEAITFAEAGELDTARRLAQEIFPGDAARGEQILAVGGAAGFSERMIDDALGLAERLDYGLVALTVSPPLARLIARLGARRRGAGRRLSPEAFRARAEERAVPFVHTLRRGDPEKAIADVSRTFRRIAFLLVERDLTPRARFAGVDVPIFYLADA
jgi:hypothetical protein